MSPVPVALFAALAIGAWAAPPQTKTQKAPSKASAAKSTSASAARKKSVAKTTAAAKTAAKTSTARPATAAKRTTASKSASRRPVVVVHRAQQQPTPDRYKEIQQALAAKGYFTGEADGNWGPASVDALKRFQRDQNIPDDGKIGSLSLIALGLGPKREATEQPQKAAESEQKIP